MNRLNPIFIHGLNLSKPFLGRLVPLVLVSVTLQTLVCSAGGPPFPRKPKNAESTKLEGAFRFTPGTPLYKDPMLGELYLEGPARSGGTYFRMRIMGRTHRTRNIEMRSYEGRAWQKGNLLELRARRCYLYERKDWEERLAPKERWACDHLVFRFRSRDNFAGRDQLKGVPGPYTIYSNWLGQMELTPLPYPEPGQAPPVHAEVPGGIEIVNEKEVPPEKREKGPIYFGGQIAETTRDGRVVVWGYRADRRMENGMELTVLDKNYTKIGTLLIESRPGDILLCAWKGKAPAETEIVPGLLAYNVKGPARPSGLFD